MTDRDPLPAPPPVAPLDDATRARLRARVVAGLDDDRIAEPRRPRRWAVPAAAAAAVLVVAGAATGLALGNGSESPGTAVGPAATGATTGSTTGSGTPPPVEESATPTPGSGESTPPRDAACDRELRFVLQGADPVTSTSSQTGTTTFYVAGDRWTLCSTHGGRATVHRPRDLAAPDDREAYGVSTVFSAGNTSTYVAGGLLPDGVTDADISYRFADDHVEPATLVTDDAGRTWWQMEYTVSGGAMNTGSTRGLDPILADVVYEGVEARYALDWGRDTCQQANHGC